MREFSVLVRPAPDLPGQWIAHCLNWDLVTQGDSPSNATQMICEAIFFAIEEDSKENLDPSDRGAAPPEFWDLFVKTQYSGARISPKDMDKFASSKNAVIATTLYLQESSASRASEIPIPPAFMIDALQDQNCSLL